MEERTTGGRTSVEPFDERQLAEHARRFFEISDDLLAILDMEGSIVWASASWERLLEIDRDELLGDGYMQLLHPEDLSRSADALAGTLRDLTVVPNFENRYRAGDGSYRTLLWSASIDREHGLIYTAAKDITEQRRSRDEIAASRRRLAETQRISRIGGWTYDPATGAVIWSEELFRIFRRDPAEFSPTYERHMALVHPEDIKRLEQALASLWETSIPYAFDYRIVADDGGTRTLFTRAHIEIREDGSRYIAGVCQDVTEARGAEAQLAGSLSIHKATLEATADAILVVDTEGRTVTWNQNFVEMWQIPAAIIEEREDEKLLAFALEQLREPDAFIARVRELYANPERESFDIVEFKDGRVFERYSAPQRLEGEVVGRVWSFSDVTDRLRAERENLGLEARLQQSQRLESLGRLAGGIAHDFNNHLVAILNYATLAGDDLPEGTAARDDLDEVVSAAEDASALTRELLAFSRQEMVEPRPLLLNFLVADTERLLRRTIGEDIELHVELGPDMPAIEADPSQLERVLMNLAVNARDAMPEGGALRIKTERVDVASGGGRGGPSGSVVRLSVSDDGTGMTEDVAKRALEPFFTTKPSGEGTGLGLATVYGIVNQSGGRLAIDSTPGRGTTMTIDLPSSAKPPEPASEPPEPTQVNAEGMVLVVEDEDPVRRLTARLLRDAGFRTMEAADGEEAMSLLDGEEAHELRLLVTDVVMPRMSGRELAERVHESRPDLAVLFMSGYTDDVVVRHGVASADIPFVAKPFTREALLEAVNEAIDAGPRPLA